MHYPLELLLLDFFLYLVAGVGTTIGSLSFFSLLLRLLSCFALVLDDEILLYRNFKRTVFVFSLLEAHFLLSLFLVVCLFFLLFLELFGTFLLDPFNARRAGSVSLACSCVLLLLLLRFRFSEIERFFFSTFLCLLFSELERFFFSFFL